MEMILTIALLALALLACAVLFTAKLTSLEAEAAATKAQLLERIAIAESHIIGINSDIGQIVHAINGTRPEPSPEQTPPVAAEPV
ncbi:MAG: hypothetical protein ACRC8R_11945 [Aeromonas hydrophila]